MESLGLKDYEICDSQYWAMNYHFCDVIVLTNMFHSRYIVSSPTPPLGKLTGHAHQRSLRPLQTGLQTHADVDS